MTILEFGEFGEQKLQVDAYVHVGDDVNHRKTVIDGDTIIQFTHPDEPLMLSMEDGDYWIDHA